MKASPAE